MNVETSLALGIDLGTSGVRIAVLNQQGTLIHSSSAEYATQLTAPLDWAEACRDLITHLPAQIRGQLAAVAVDGTSGTLLACREDGTPMGPALSYATAFPEQTSALKRLVPDGCAASSSSGSLARALQLLNHHGHIDRLRHQADWISGWFLQNWQWGEEGNNLKLGWDLEQATWQGCIADQSWSSALPEVKPSGSVLGRIAIDQARNLGVPEDLLVVAGTTDSNAAVLAANPGDNDGITVLGTTLVMKRFTPVPIQGAGITRHRIGQRWLCGGASNAGAGVLRRYFSDAELEELSRQIDPDRDSGLRYRPLPARGERFPVDDPNLEPVLEPRPVSDALFLHGLLEGLAEIEAEGWARLTELGAGPPQRVISLGGGARNPQWRKIRQRRLGLPVVSCNQPPAAGVALLALSRQRQTEYKMNKS